METAEYLSEEEVKLTVTADHILEEEVLMVTAECVPMEEELTTKLMLVADCQVCT